MKVDIKPISVNQVWQGRRYKTAEYKKWRIDFGYLLEKPIKKIKGWVEVKIKVYIKNFERVDTDNLLKPCLDALVENEIIQDDRFIKKISIEKIKSDKEYIEIEIEKII